MSEQRDYQRPFMQSLPFLAWWSLAGMVLVAFGLDLYRIQFDPGWKPLLIAVGGWFLGELIGIPFGRGYFGQAAKADSLAPILPG